MNTQQSIFKCKHCHTPLGVTAGSILHVGAVEFVKPVSLRCVKCQRATFWAPARGEQVGARAEAA